MVGGMVVWQVVGGGCSRLQIEAEPDIGERGEPSFESGGPNWVSQEIHPKASAKAASSWAMT